MCAPSYGRLVSEVSRAHVTAAIADRQEGRVVKRAYFGGNPARRGSRGPRVVERIAQASRRGIYEKRGAPVLISTRTG